MIKPCPFCGVQPKITHDREQAGHGMTLEHTYVQCECGAQMKANGYYFSTRDKGIRHAVDQWNRRVD